MSEAKRVTKMCCVPQCSNRADSGLSFHQFPKALKLRKTWQNALRMVEGKAVKRLKSNTVPSQNIPIRTHDRLTNDEKKKREEGRQERATKRTKASDLSKASASSINDSNDAETDGANLLNEAPLEESNYTHTSTQTDVEIVFQVPPKPSDKEDKKISVVNLLTCAEELKNLTGLHSFELLDVLEQCVGDLILENRSHKELTLRNRIILTFTKLKLSLKFTTLAILFGVSRTTCANYVKELIPMLREVLVTMVPWPDHETIKMNLPIAFKNFRNTRIVLDCAETPIEKSKCLMCRILTWSNYKGKQTAKFDVGVAPSGLICHISRAYGGRASDKLIVNHSGILDQLVYRDAVMTDKGFRIEEECLMRNLILHRPPFVIQKKQMPRAEALRCAEIARARVHVERVIQRIRDFEFMCEPVPWELLPYFDDILVIVCGIVNLGPPVLNIDKFM